MGHDPKNLPPTVRFGVDAIKFASINNFIEQIPIAVLARDRPFLRRLLVMPLEKAVIDAMGLGGAGTRIVEPGAGMPDVSDLQIEVVDIPGTGARSDTPNYISISRELIDRIVENAVARHFGAVEEYENHLKQILAMTDRPIRPLDRPEPTNYRNFVEFRVDGDDNSKFPIGQVVDNAANASLANPYSKVRAFAQEVVGELIFIGSHEVGHLRLKHHESPRKACADFRKFEQEADEYAAKALADFQFNMTPMTEGVAVPPMANFETFFNFYRQSGLTITDNETRCVYQPPQQRLYQVSAVYTNRIRTLVSETYSSADYTTPNPTASICTTNGKTWKKPL